MLDYLPAKRTRPVSRVKGSRLYSWCFSCLSTVDDADGEAL